MAFQIEEVRSKVDFEYDAEDMALSIILKDEKTFTKAVLDSNEIYQLHAYLGSILETR